MPQVRPLSEPSRDTCHRFARSTDHEEDLLKKGRQHVRGTVSIKKTWWSKHASDCWSNFVETALTQSITKYLSSSSTVSKLFFPRKKSNENHGKRFSRQISGNTDRIYSSIEHHIPHLHFYYHCFCHERVTDAHDWRHRRRSMLTSPTQGLTDRARACSSLTKDE